MLEKLNHFRNPIKNFYAIKQPSFEDIVYHRAINSYSRGMAIVHNACTYLCQFCSWLSSKGQITSITSFPLEHSVPIEASG